MDVNELEALAESTALALSRANQRLMDLETQMSTHVGLDWGSTGLNYPHPNMSVDTIEFGGGIAREDTQGIQFISLQSLFPERGLFWTPEFKAVLNTSVYPLAIIAGYADAASDTALRLISQRASFKTAEITISASQTSDAQSIQLAASSLAATSYIQVDASDSANRGQVLLSGMVAINAWADVTLSGSVNNWNPSNIVGFISVVRVASSVGAVNITGLAQNNSPMGRIFFIHNIDATDTITLTDEDAASTAANRFALPGGNLALPPDGCAILQYDITSSRWRCIGAYTGATSGGGHTIEDEGVALPAQTSLNFVGAGVTATDAGGKTVVTIPGGGSPSATTVEVDLGSTPITRGTFTITDAAIGATSKVLCWQAPGPYTGKGNRADEAEMQPVNVIAVNPAAGSATVYWETPPIITMDPVLNKSPKLNPAGATFDRLVNQRTPASFTPIRIGRVKGNVKFSYIVLT